MIYPDLPERAISIRQPWAWAILNAGKDVENRSRRTHYRGSICIHASLHTPTKADAEVFYEVASRSDTSSKTQWAAALSGGLPRGGIIGTAEIVDCIDTSDSPWFFGPFGYVLTNVQPVPFIPVSGALGMFRWRDRITTAQE